LNFVIEGAFEVGRDTVVARTRRGTDGNAFDFAAMALGGLFVSMG
jgi:hypothetical protein